LLLKNRNTVTYFIADMSDEVGLKLSFRKGKDAELFKVVELKDKEKRWKTIQKRMKEAVGSKSDIVVFPEMTICPELRARLQDYLLNSRTDISLVVAGSFHEVAQPIDSLYLNKCYVLNNKGTVEAEICKRIRSEMRGSATQGMIREDIKDGDEISILLTPIGTINVSICADFNYWDKSVRDILDEISSDVYLVPSMGDETNIDSHKSRAIVITGDSSHTTVVVANEHPESLSGNKYKGFVKTSAIKMPVFVNRRNRSVKIDLS
jgi:predicted amidohydrolase